MSGQRKSSDATNSQEDLEAVANATALLAALCNKAGLKMSSVVWEPSKTKTKAVRAREAAVMEASATGVASFVSKPTGRFEWWKVIE
jgi:hypothetical protein